jgi:hypothetical protein
VRAKERERFPAAKHIPVHLVGAVDEMEGRAGDGPGEGLRSPFLGQGDLGLGKHLDHLLDQPNELFGRRQLDASQRNVFVEPQLLRLPHLQVILQIRRLLVLLQLLRSLLCSKSPYATVRVSLEGGPKRKSTLARTSRLNVLYDDRVDEV